MEDKLSDQVKVKAKIDANFENLEGSLDTSVTHGGVDVDILNGDG